MYCTVVHYLFYFQSSNCLISSFFFCVHFCVNKEGGRIMVLPNIDISDLFPRQETLGTRLQHSILGKTLRSRWSDAKWWFRAKETLKRIVFCSFLWGVSCEIRRFLSFPRALNMLRSKSSQTPVFFWSQPSQCYGCSISHRLPIVLKTVTIIIFSLTPWYPSRQNAKTAENRCL